MRRIAAVIGDAVDAQARRIAQSKNAAFVDENARRERDALGLSRSDRAGRQRDARSRIGEDRPAGKVERRSRHVGDDRDARPVRRAMRRGDLRGAALLRKRRAEPVGEIVCRRLGAGGAGDRFAILVGVPGLDLKSEKDRRHAPRLLVPDEAGAVVPGAVFVDALVDRPRIALRHMDIVEAERGIGRIAEGCVGLVRIILVKGVAVEKHVGADLPGDLQIRLQSMDKRIAGVAFSGQNPHLARIEHIAALEIERAGGIVSVHGRKSGRARENRRVRPDA